MTFFYKYSAERNGTKTTTETRVKVYSRVKSGYPNIQTTEFLRVSTLQPKLTSLIITRVPYVENVHFEVIKKKKKIHRITT